MIEMTLKELRALDYSKTFAPRGAAAYHYFIEPGIQKLQQTGVLCEPPEE